MQVLETNGLGARRRSLVSRTGALRHHPIVAAPSSRATSAFLALSIALGASPGCVDEVRVLGDERARQACEGALGLAAPSFGCSVVQVTSREPWGCAIDQGFGIVETRAGSWVRIARTSDRPATLRLTLLSGAPAECDGGAPVPCDLVVRSGAGTPCSCELGRYASYPVPPMGVPLEIDLFDVETEVLLQPYGATFEVAVCDGPPSP